MKKNFNKVPTKLRQSIPDTHVYQHSHNKSIAAGIYMFIM